MPYTVGYEISCDEVQISDSEAVLRYWEERRGGRLAPSWREFDLMELPLKAIPRVIVVDIVENPLDFLYRFWGTEHTASHGYDLTGRSVRQLKPTDYAEMMFRQYQETFESREPRLFVNQYPVKPAIWNRYEIVRVPLSGDGQTIDIILSLESFLDDAVEARTTPASAD